MDTFVGVERILLVRFAVMAAHSAIFVKAPTILLLTIFTHLLAIFTHLLAIFTGSVVMSCVA